MVFNFSDVFLKRMLEWSVENSPSGKRYHITRVAMYKALDQKFADQQSKAKVLSISKSGSLIDVLGIQAGEIVSADYPAHNIMNLKNFADNEFDYVLSDQVFEHIEGDPFEAFRQTVRVLKPGGRVCHTSCFINPVHGHPSDFWRFTPDAMRLMAEAAGCKEIDVGGWGNKEAWALVALGLRRLPLPDDPEHPLHKLATHNDRRWPIVVWVTARKPFADPEAEAPQADRVSRVFRISPPNDTAATLKGGRRRKTQPKLAIGGSSG